MWWVTNGLAFAPPAIVFNIGVSTSKNPLSSKYDLRAFKALVLVKNASLTSGLTIKSILNLGLLTHDIFLVKLEVI